MQTPTMINGHVVAVEKAVVLRGEDFPTLQAALPPPPVSIHQRQREQHLKQREKHHELKEQQQEFQFLSEQHDEVLLSQLGGPQLQPAQQSSVQTKSEQIHKDLSEESNLLEQQRFTDSELSARSSSKAGNHSLGPASSGPYQRRRSNWTDDERDSTFRPQGDSYFEYSDRSDRESDLQPGNRVSENYGYGRSLASRKMPFTPGHDGPCGKVAESRESGFNGDSSFGSESSSSGYGADNSFGRGNKTGRERGFREWRESSFGGQGFSRERNRDAGFSEKSVHENDEGDVRPISRGRDGLDDRHGFGNRDLGPHRDASLGREGASNRDNFFGRDNRRILGGNYDAGRGRLGGDRSLRSCASGEYCPGRDFSGQELATWRDRQLHQAHHFIISHGRNSEENLGLDNFRPSQGIGIDPPVIPMLGFRRRREEAKVDDFRDEERESFEAELERVQKAQELDRQLKLEEKEHAVEMAQKELEDRARQAREEEEERQAMARTELRVKVLAARDLKRDEGSGSRPMSVYSLLWNDPALKLATRVHVEGGHDPVWNDEMVFSLREDVLLLPHSAITIKVVSEVRSEGSWRNSTLLGTAYLPLRDIATAEAMRKSPEDADIVQLQLEEERRKENTLRKLLEREEYIAKREAESKQQEQTPPYFHGLETTKPSFYGCLRHKQLLPLGHSRQLVPPPPGWMGPVRPPIGHSGEQAFLASSHSVKEVDISPRQETPQGMQIEKSRGEKGRFASSMPSMGSSSFDNCVGDKNSSISGACDTSTSAPSKGGMQLGTSTKTNQFSELLKADLGEVIGDDVAPGPMRSIATTPIISDPLLMGVDEKISKKDGGLENLEVQGSMPLVVQKKEDAYIRIQDEEHEDEDREGGEGFCVICMDTIASYKGRIGGCGHIFCWEHIHPWALGHDMCPLCKGPIVSVDRIPYAGVMTSSICGDISSLTWRAGSPTSFSDQVVEPSVASVSSDATSSVASHCEQCRSTYQYDLVQCHRCRTCRHSYCDTWYCSLCSGYS